MTPWNARHALTALALLASLTACGEDPAPTAADPTDTPTATSSRTPEPTPTPSTSPTPTPTPSPSPTQAPRRSLTDRLLPAEELPGFNEIFTWEIGTTAPQEPADPLQCQPFGLLSIGATKVAHRTYLPADASTSTALEIVADFPDPMTAKRAYSVVRSWYDDCSRDHDGDPKVGQFTPVTLTTRGAAGWHLLTYGDAFDAHGFVQRGPRIAVVVLTLRDAQDYNYAAGQEPMVAALQRAAALL